MEVVQTGRLRWRLLLGASCTTFVVATSRRAEKVPTGTSGRLHNRMSHFDKKTSPARRVSKFSFTRCMVQSSRTPQVFQSHEQASHEQATTPTFACGLSVGLQVGQVRGLASRSGCRGGFAGNTSVAWIYRVATFLRTVLVSLSDAGTSRRKQEGRQPTQKHTKAAVTTRTPSLADRWTRRSLVAMSRCTTFAVPTSSNGQTICTIKIIPICAKEGLIERTSSTDWTCAIDTAHMVQPVSTRKTGSPS